MVELRTKEKNIAKASIKHKLVMGEEKSLMAQHYEHNHKDKQTKFQTILISKK